MHTTTSEELHMVHGTAGQIPHVQHINVSSARSRVHMASVRVCRRDRARAIWTFGHGTFDGSLHGFDYVSVRKVNTSEACGGRTFWRVSVIVAQYI